METYGVLGSYGRRARRKGGGAHNVRGEKKKEAASSGVASKGPPHSGVRRKPDRTGGSEAEQKGTLNGGGRGKGGGLPFSDNEAKRGGSTCVGRPTGRCNTAKDSHPNAEDR